MKIETIPTINSFSPEQAASARSEDQAGLSAGAFSALLDQAVTAAGGVIVTPEALPQTGKAPPGRESAPDGDRARSEQVGFGLSMAISPATAPEIVVPDLRTASDTGGPASESPETESAEAMPDTVPPAGDTAVEAAPASGSPAPPVLIPVGAPPGAALDEGQRPASSPDAARLPEPAAGTLCGPPASDASSIDQLQVNHDAQPAAQPAPRHTTEPETRCAARIVSPVDSIPLAAAGSEGSSQPLASALMIVQLQRYSAGDMDPVPPGECRLGHERDSSRSAATAKPPLVPTAEKQSAFESSELDWLQGRMMLLRSAPTTAEAPAQANQGATGSGHSLSESEQFATDLALASAQVFSSLSSDREPPPAFPGQGHNGNAVPNPLAGTAEARTLSNLFGEKTAVSRLQTEIAFAEPDFLSRVAEQMHLQVREGRNLIRIQLKPSLLGRVEIRAESGGSGLAATILTESLGVKNYLEQNLHVLYRSLQDLGLKLDRILVLEESWTNHPAGQHSYQETRSDEEGHHSSPPNPCPGRDAEVPGESLGTGLLLSAVLAPHSTFHVVA